MTVPAVPPLTRHMADKVLKWLEEDWGMKKPFDLLEEQAEHVGVMRDIVKHLNTVVCDHTPALTVRAEAAQLAVSDELRGLKAIVNQPTNYGVHKMQVFEAIVVQKDEDGVFTQVVSHGCHQILAQNTEHAKMKVVRMLSDDLSLDDVEILVRPFC